MFQLHFILQNIHYTISLILSFIFFTILWLYFDAWRRKKTTKHTLTLIGYFFLSLSFVVYALYAEKTFVAASFFSSMTMVWVSILLRVVGYISLVVSLLVDPLQQRPRYASTNAQALFLLPVTFLPLQLVFLLPLLCVAIGFLSLRKATVGLENHFKPVSVAFFLLAVAELAGTLMVFRTSANVSIASFAAAYSYAWMISHVFLALSAVAFAVWTFQYLLTRIRTQLYLIFTTGILAVFLLVTLTYTMLLFRNMQKEALDHLLVDVKVFQYAIDSKKAALLADASVVAQHPQVVQALQTKERKILQDVTQSLFLGRKQSSLILADQNGMIVYRAEDPERYGDSMSNHPLFRRVLDTKEGTVSILTRDGVLAPEVSIQSSMPIFKGEAIIGVVLATSDIDTAFLDGIKKATGLDVALYGGNIRSATTLYGPDGRSRWVGIKEESEDVIRRVLQEGKTYSGQKDLLNISYVTAYAPLVDVDTNPVGMLSVAKQQYTLLQTTTQSTQIAFLLSTLLVFLSFIPTYFIAKYISYQIQE